MVGWLWRVLVGRLHSHFWKSISVDDVVGKGGLEARLYTDRCIWCGDVRAKTVRPEVD